MPILLIVVLVVLLIIVLFIIANYNSLVRLRNKVRNQFSQIDVQLKKRSDLVPNLVETVKGYTKHESETLENIVNARNKYLSAKNENDKVNASNEMSDSLTKLFALAESYPELKSNSNFESLQNQLQEVEEKISYARQFYNDTVLMYNNKVEVFPSNIIASMFGFKKDAFFEANEEERENVKVKF